MGSGPGRIRPAGVDSTFSSPSLTPQDNRIEYDRGTILEWYVNDRRGLKQGFALASPPPGGGAVHLDMELTGTLSPAISEDGQAIDFRTSAAPGAIRYSRLLVLDAAGQELPAWMEGFPRGDAWDPDRLR